MALDDIAALLTLLVALAGTLIFGSTVVGAIRTGEFPDKWDIAAKKDQPFSYWWRLVSHIVVVGLLWTLGLWALYRLAG
jgi:uncharacterized BrkB/YihY/UPF0761 family membrane protein